MIKVETIDMKGSPSKPNWPHEFPDVFTQGIIFKIKSACFKDDWKRK